MLDDGSGSDVEESSVGIEPVVPGDVVPGDVAPSVDVGVSDVADPVIEGPLALSVAWSGSESDPQPQTSRPTTQARNERAGVLTRP